MINIQDTTIPTLDKYHSRETLTAHKKNQGIEALRRLTRGVSPPRQLLGESVNNATKKSTGLWFVGKGEDDVQFDSAMEILHEIDPVTLLRVPRRFVNIGFSNPFTVNREIVRIKATIIGIDGTRNGMWVVTRKVKPTDVASDVQIWKVNAESHCMENLAAEIPNQAYIGGGGDDSEIVLASGSTLSYIDVNNDFVPLRQATPRDRFGGFLQMKCVGGGAAVTWTVSANLLYALDSADGAIIAQSERIKLNDNTVGSKLVTKEPSSLTFVDCGGSSTSAYVAVIAKYLEANGAFIEERGYLLSYKLQSGKLTHVHTTFAPDRVPVGFGGAG